MKIFRNVFGQSRTESGYCNGKANRRNRKNKLIDTKSFCTDCSREEYPIEETYDFIMKNGALAAKISGAGGGGFMMILCDPKQRYELIKALKKRQEGKVKIVNFVKYGAQSWTINDESND